MRHRLRVRGPWCRINVQQEAAMSFQPSIQTRRPVRRHLHGIPPGLAMPMLLFAALLGGGATAEDFTFFERHIRPVLVDQCYSCHSLESPVLRGGLLLDSQAGMLQGGLSGQPAVSPGAPDASKILHALRYADPDLQMPPSGRLPDSVIAAFEQWIREGAPDPRTVDTTAPAVDPAEHWAFHPPVAPPVPETQDTAWPQTPIDHFILARLEAEGLRPAPPADRRALIRRATYALTGLPPTPEEVRNFLEDDAPGAWERLIERLLDSPQYGERWGRHWLDVARYADTKGYVYQDREENRFVHSHVYRDWVVNALNEDRPYDEFIRMQIAADQLAEDPADLAAMGFLTLGQRFLGVTHDIIDDRIDVATRGLMGLTVSCARCHDHKFDPISIGEYYGLYGVFSASSERLVRIAPGRATESFEAGLEEREENLRAAFTAHSEALAERLRGQVAQYLAAVPGVAALPTEEFYEIRGPEDLNPSVVRRWHAHIEQQPADHPVFGLWRRFAALPETGFAEHAQELLARPGEHTNPRLLAALRETPPASMQEMAEVYGALLATIHAEWQARLEAAETGEEPHPTQLEQADAEELRLVLYAAEAPVRVPEGAIVDVEWYFDEPARVEMSKLQLEIDRWIIQQESSPPFSVVLEDKPDPPEPQVFLRGNPASRGDAVPRAFPAMLGGGPFEQGSGRVELARAIADPDNPLTARVIVNRVWLHHFGAGLVTTPSDFGTRAAAPSHPELLDWLATHFVAEGWSIKQLHRLIMRSSVYQQAASAHDTLAATRDPENRLLWRFNRQRLDFEALRDSFLHAAGALDLDRGGPSTPLFGAEENTRRTLYGFVDRQFLAPIYRVFDFPNPDMHSPQRFDTMVPQQALFLMNSPFLQEQAQALAARSATRAQPEARVTRLYQLAYQRPPAPEEKERALDFVHNAVARPAPEVPEIPVSPWEYGYGAYDADAGRVANFTPLPHFTGSAWQGGTSWPDPALGWVQLHAEGGHPGNTPAHAAIRRWAAPTAMTLTLSGTLTHEPAEGDGILARVVSSRDGMLGEWPLHQDSVETRVETVRVEAGDTLDFIVEIGGSLNSNQYLWAPVVDVVDPADTENEVARWDARADFAGPAPEAPPVPLQPWEKLAQVLLLSNEFLFLE